MIRTSTLPAVVICLFTAAAHGQQKTPGEMPHERALLILRAINSAQAEAVRKEKRYVALPRLSQESAFLLPELQGMKQGVALAPDGGPIPVGSYTLRVEPSDSGKRYFVTLTTEAPCALSWFTGESGVIYEGRATGCAAQ
jgi:hypothetical protein